MAKKTISSSSGVNVVTGIDSNADIPGLCLTNLSFSEVGDEARKYCRGALLNIEWTNVGLQVEGEAKVLNGFSALSRGEYFRMIHTTADAYYDEIFAATDIAGQQQATESAPGAADQDAWLITDWNLVEASDETDEDSTFTFTAIRTPELQP